MSKHILNTSAVAKAVNTNLQETTHDGYPFGAHVFDMLLNARVDIIIARPNLYSNISPADISDYITFRQTADPDCVSDPEWLTGNPDQYLFGYINKQWKLAHSLATDSLSNPTLVPREAMANIRP